MGEIADDCFDRAMEEEMDVDGEYARRMYSRPRPVTCNRCGKTNLKWRDGVLIENERVHPGNYKPEHLCPTTADGFEEVL